MTFQARLKEARASIGCSQVEMAAQIGVSARSYQGYEDGRSLPCAEAIAGIVGTGINANWLLTGEGPMRLSDLVAPVPQAAPSPPPQDLNQTYLSIAIQGVLEARPELAPAQQARLAADIYLRFLSMNMAKPEAA